MAGERWAHLHENWLILLLSCVYFSSLLWFPAKRRALTVQQISSSWPKQDQMYSKVRSSAGCSFLSACLVCWPVYFFHWLRKHGIKTWSWVPGEWGTEGKDLFKFCSGHIRIILPGGSSSHTNCWFFFSELPHLLSFLPACQQSEILGWYLPDVYSLKSGKLCKLNTLLIRVYYMLFK